MKVKLMTATGHPIRESEIPEFNEYPQVLLWGDRVFSKSKPGEYKECFSYTVVE